MKRNKNKIIALFLTVIMLLGTTVPAYAQTNSTKDKKDKQVNTNAYYIDKDGKAKKSDLTTDFFIALSKNGKAKLPSSNSTDIITTSIIVDPYDDDAIRITPTVQKSYTNSTINSVIDAANGTIFSFAWTSLGAYLINAGIGTRILQNTWLNCFCSTVAGMLVSSALNFAHVSPTYFETYQYECWNYALNCYVIYQAIIYYSDSAFTQPLSVYYCIVRWGDYEAGSTR